MLRSRVLLVPLLGVLVLGTSSCDLVNRGLEDRFGTCGTYDPLETDVSTSEAVFRGTWSGTVDDWPVFGDATDLTLDVDVTFEDADGYTITGTFQLGTDPELALIGSVDGGCDETYVTSAASTLEPESMPPGPSMIAEARDGDTVVWALSAGWYRVLLGWEDPATITLNVNRVDANGDETFWTSLELGRTAFP